MIADSNYAKVLGVAYFLSARYGPFTPEELAVACFARHGAAFGLAGFGEDYPDVRKVATCLYGKRGLIARGLLEKLPDGRLRVPARPVQTAADERPVRPWSELMGGN